MLGAGTARSSTAAILLSACAGSRTRLIFVDGVEATVVDRQHFGPRLLDTASQHFLGLCLPCTLVLIPRWRASSSWISIRPGGDPRSRRVGRRSELVILLAGIDCPHDVGTHETRRELVSGNAV